MKRLACLAHTNTDLEFQDATQAVLDGAHICGRKLPFVPGYSAFIDGPDLVTNRDRAFPRRGRGDDDRRVRAGAGKKRYDNDGPPRTVQSVGRYHYGRP